MLPLETKKMTPPLSPDQRYLELLEQLKASNDPDEITELEDKLYDLRNFENLNRRFIKDQVKLRGLIE